MIKVSQIEVETIVEDWHGCFAILDMQFPSWPLKWLQNAHSYIPNLKEGMGNRARNT